MYLQLSGCYSAGGEDPQEGPPQAPPRDSRPLAMCLWSIQASVSMGGWVGSVPVICGAPAEQAPLCPSLICRGCVPRAPQVRVGIGARRCRPYLNRPTHGWTTPCRRRSGPTLISQVGVAGVDWIFRHPVGVPRQHVVVRARGQEEVEPAPLLAVLDESRQFTVGGKDVLVPDRRVSDQEHQGHAARRTF